MAKSLPHSYDAYRVDFSLPASDRFSESAEAKGRSQSGSHTIKSQ